jgi:hypothetical protein
VLWPTGNEIVIRISTKRSRNAVSPLGCEMRQGHGRGMVDGGRCGPLLRVLA